MDQVVFDRFQFHEKDFFVSTGRDAIIYKNKVFPIRFIERTQESEYGYYPKGDPSPEVVEILSRLESKKVVQTRFENRKVIGLTPSLKDAIEKLDPGGIIERRTTMNIYLARVHRLVLISEIEYINGEALGLEKQILIQYFTARQRLGK